MPPTTTKLPTGPPQALIERINYLNKLLTNPYLLVRQMRHTVSSSMKKASLFSGAVFPEAQYVLEASFETWQGPVRFREHGDRVQALIPFLTPVVKQMTPGEWNMFGAGWMDKLINGAKESGAVVPSRTKRHREHEQGDGIESRATEVLNIPPPKKSREKAALIIVDSNSDLTEPSILSSIPKQTLVPNVTIPSTVDVSLTKNQQATLTGMG
ncbi:hypothetical protein C8R45DRAFT_924066 [Mycena sanguinolenta]|nr:hypothetical protein C8R45DRAFT_924066 [Mycena sanguinolenta]